MSRLNRALEYVRTVFFPRWDRQGAWSVEEVCDLPAKGKCDRKHKALLLRHAFKDDDSLHCLLIHEICHAVTDDYHTKRWLGRYRKAGQRADRMGRHHLALMIREEAELYADPASSIRTDAKTVYGLIRSFVKANPYIPFKTTIKIIATSLAYCPNEFLEKWKRSQEVFRRAVSEYSRRREIPPDMERREYNGRLVRRDIPEKKPPGKIRPSAANG